MLSRSSETGEGRSRAFEPILIGPLLWWGKLSFNGDRRYISRFKIFSSSQKVNPDSRNDDETFFLYGEVPVIFVDPNYT
jgi:hypothetical protein